jgi:hypothetical protein
MKRRMNRFETVAIKNGPNKTQYSQIYKNTKNKMDWAYLKNIKKGRWKEQQSGDQSQ